MIEAHVVGAGRTTRPHQTVARRLMLAAHLHVDAAGIVDERPTDGHLVPTRGFGIAVDGHFSSARGGRSADSVPNPGFVF